MFFFFFSSRRRHTRSGGDWSSDVCSSDLLVQRLADAPRRTEGRKDIERRELERTEREIARRWDRLRRPGGEGDHAARHVRGGSYEQITPPSVLLEEFLDLQRAFKGVAR